MMGRSHLLHGAVAGALATHYLAGALPAETVLYAAVGAVAGLAPDLDHPHARLGRLLPGWWHKLTPGHRGVTHSVVWVLGFGVVLGVAAILAGAPVRVAGALGLAATAGAFSHVAADGITHQGVPWAWPWRRERYRLPPGWSIRTGGAGERVVTALVVAGGLLGLAG